MLLISSCLGVLAPLVCFLIHVLAYRCIPSLKSKPRQKVAAMVILISVFALGLAAWFLTRDLGEAIHAGVVSLLFGYTYFHWFNMSETARRIRILVRYVALGLAPDSAHGEIYNPEVIFANRLRRLQETGSLAFEGNRYRANSGALLWATRLILFWRTLFYGRD